MCRKIIHESPLWYWFEGDRVRYVFLDPTSDSGHHIHDEHQNFVSTSLLPMLHRGTNVVVDISHYYGGEVRLGDPSNSRTFSGPSAESLRGVGREGQADDVGANVGQ